MSVKTKLSGSLTNLITLFFSRRMELFNVDVDIIKAIERSSFLESVYKKDNYLSQEFIADSYFF